MDDIYERSESKINFIPCATWVRRGVAKPVPERVQLTQEELAAVIQQTKVDIQDIENESDGEKENCAEEVEVKQEMDDVKVEVIKVKKEEEVVKSSQPGKSEADIMDEYDLADYDNDGEDAAKLLGLGDLTVYSDPKEDPYLDHQEDEDDIEDKEDFNIRGTDNLILAGHIEGESATLEIYVYNDVEDAFYIHHDILLPSLPLALEWLSFDPESDTRGNLVAVGYMQPVIEVWDLDIVDSLEPAFRLGKKAKKKKKIAGIGHTDAVLSLAWNPAAEHVLASGSVDQTVLLWDMTQQTVASALRFHKEKVQSLAWHPFEAQTLASGCCDGKVRVVDCRSQDSHKKWKVNGEVERVLWDHFNPFQCIASTDSGTIHCIDVRKDSPVWTLSAHDEGVTGISLSSQCPGCLVSVSSDKSMKVWDIAGNKPECVLASNAKLGVLQTVIGCPDAPFVVCMGGDNPSQNFKVMDIRESAQVRQRFGKRQLQNPLGTADFGYATADDAEPEDEMETENAAVSLGSLSLNPDSAAVKTEDEGPRPSGGAVSKFKNKNKDKKKKKKKEF